jgi:hypothetical protein
MAPEVVTTQFLPLADGTSNRLSMGSELITSGGTIASLGGSGTGVEIDPVSAMGDGDLQALNAFTTNNFANPAREQALRHVSRDLSHDVILFPAVTSGTAEVVATSSGGALTVGASWNDPPMAELYALRTNQGRRWDMFVSPGSVVAQLAFELPDLSAVAGWDANLNLQTAQLGWSLEAWTGASFDEFTRRLPTGEAEMRMNGWNGSLRP